MRQNTGRPGRRGGRRRQRVLADSIGPIVTAEALEGRLLFNNYTVTNGGDSGAGSLRDAIAQANATSVDDTITLNPLVSPTLSTGQLILTAGGGTTTITAVSPGNSQINANSTSRILRIEAGASAVINGIAFVNGSASGTTSDNGYGAGLLNYGSLTMTGCAVNSCIASQRGGGIYSGTGSTLSMTNCTVYNAHAYDSGSSNASFGGGGIYALSATVSLSNCTFATDHADVGAGGAIYSNGSAMTLQSCTITGGHSWYEGAGIFTTGSGASTTLHNSIVAGNAGDQFLDGDDVGGFALAAGSSYNLIGAIASYNGITAGVNGNIGGTSASPMNARLSAAGFYSSPGLRMVALLPGSPAIDAGGGVGATASDERGVARTFGSAADIGAFESRGFNIVVNSGNNQTTRQYSYFDSPLVALVSSSFGDPVAGGAVTFSGPASGAGIIAPALPSTINVNNGATASVISNGVDGTYTVNASARGAASPAAFTLTNSGAPLPLIVNTVVDEQLPSSPTTLSLRVALTYAGVRPGDNTISFDPSVFTPQALHTLTNSTSSPFEITDTTGQTIIQGPGSNVLAISPNNSVAIAGFQIDAGASATISNLTLTHPFARPGSGVYNAGTLTLAQCAVTANTRGVYSDLGSTTNINQCTFTGNTAYFAKGGGVYGTGATINITDTTITGLGFGSQVADYGAGVYAGPSTALTMRNCTLTGLRAQVHGGGVYSEGTGVCTLSNCTIDSNSAGSSGGGVYIAAGTGHTIVNCTITGNSGSGTGGLLGPGGGGLTLHNTIVAANSGGPGNEDLSSSTFNAANSNNLIGVIPSGIGITNGSNGNIGGTSASPLDPQLAALADNGGPTQTRVPLAGSPAIDAGSNARATAAGLTTDQRGFGRFLGTVDIGAVEVRFAYVSGNVLHVDFGGSATPISIATGGSNVNVTRGAITLPFAPASFSSVFASGAIIGDALNVNSPLAAPLGGDASAANLALNVSAGGSVVFSASQKLGALALGGGGSASLAVGGNKLLNVASLSITGSGKLDLNDNDLAIRNGSAGTWNGSAYTGVTGLVASGSNGGMWNGSGIVTSMSDAIAPNSLTSLAVAAAGDVFGISGAQTTLFDGQAIDAGTIVVKYTYAGDANLDGQITGDDYFQIDSAFPQGLHGWLSGDFNYDGLITGDDYFLIDSNFPAQGVPL